MSVGGLQVHGEPVVRAALAALFTVLLIASTIIVAWRFQTLPAWVIVPLIFLAELSLVFAWINFDKWRSRRRRHRKDSA